MPGALDGMGRVKQQQLLLVASCRSLPMPVTLRLSAAATPPLRLLVPGPWLVTSHDWLRCGFGAMKGASTFGPGMRRGLVRLHVVQIDGFRWEMSGG